jgi:hypothetical protein
MLLVGIHGDASLSKELMAVFGLKNGLQMWLMQQWRQQQILVDHNSSKHLLLTCCVKSPYFFHNLDTQVLSGENRAFR